MTVYKKFHFKSMNGLFEYLINEEEWEVGEESASIPTYDVETGDPIYADEEKKLRYRITISRESYDTGEYKHFIEKGYKKCFPKKLKLTLDDFDYETPPPKDRPILGIWLRPKLSSKVITITEHLGGKTWSCGNLGFATFGTDPSGWIDVGIEMENYEEDE